MQSEKLRREDGKTEDWKTGREEDGKMGRLKTGRLEDGKTGGGSNYQLKRRRSVTP